MSMGGRQENPSPSVGHRIDQACNRFEDAWATGQQPRIEEHLEAVPEAERPILLRELALLDIEYRRRHGEEPRVEEYRDRFPELPESFALETPLPEMKDSEAETMHHCSVSTGAPGSARPQVPGYDIRSVLGRGGMGVVYRARQVALNRVVALKMILTGAHARSDELRRFRREAEAVARVQHPNIVQIFDVGEANGQPYLAMEFVAGGSLGKKIGGTPFAAKEAARLVEILARAVHVLHQHAVVHRDLKPANVLLTGDGVPKITDFGLARLLDQETTHTQTGAILGTPSYMAPEQAGGPKQELSAAADVYALGAILYELLTGRPPFKAESPLKTLEQVVSEEPVPPARLQPRLARDLETICLKCLQKEPGKRYASASDLADDLCRFLKGGPIRARPVRQAERLWRWCRRNPMVAGLGAGLVVLLVGGTAVSSYFALQANEQAKAAKEREAETQAVLEFVQKRVFAAGQAGRLGRDVTLRRAIEEATRFLAQDFTDQPLIEARLRLTVGTLFHFLGEDQTAAEQYEAARMLYTRHRGPDHPDTLNSMNNLAASYAALGRHADAFKLREETLALRTIKLGPDHPDTLRSMNNLANSYAALGRHTDALKLCEETLALRKTKLGPDHLDTLSSMNNLAVSYRRLGRHADALKLHEETLILKKAKLGPGHPDTLTSMNNLAVSYRALGRHADALKLSEETLALQKAKLGPDHPDTLGSMHNLANGYEALGRHADALKFREETLALRKVKLGPDHPDTLVSMWGVAKSLVKLERGAEAVPVIDDCVQRAAGKVVDAGLLLEVMDLRLRHFEKTKDSAGCRQTAEMWERLNRADAASLYAAACLRAVTAAVLRGTDLKSVLQADAEADRAMAWLKQAVAAGYKDAANMAEDRNLDFLRDREDFKKLVAELVASPVKPM